MTVGYNYKKSSFYAVYYNESMSIVNLKNNWDIKLFCFYSSWLWLRFWSQLSKV